ncbi:LpxL/LpxP family Kdo(2)-lipid IV(A) lauroyl/palmitoleoyl acyltransferase [Candidatus Albibeggiatoa sp. nov. NOAA]|uniref:LpxL/LpxP family Kdo(2)-lipid IV(A) lauroyl/palmitoleoyl acyltransferase n=1 Tax=Candidatus Albibeggiatoa sp. nov. NOAA TaxID=3162724 RepID=UPI0032F6BB59|nr:LpxL/LpxP family Kdo(2)-lipid IV(A) lauroyl/palmitoleoyl acyltransferase [Thiotrichaceae bacterium]
MQTDFIALLVPRYWLTWFGLGVLWLLTRLPYAWQLAAGRQLGRIAYRLAKRRRKIAKINLDLCFPELTESERQQLLIRHFESLGMGLLEMVTAWWVADKHLAHLGQVEGYEYLEQALARGKGVILLSAHFTSLEIGTRFLTLKTKVHATYRPHENPVVELFMKKSRELHAEKAISRDAIRDMIRSLKQNKPVWFAMDQNFGHKNSVFARFFNIPAATNTATARLAKLTGAAVVPFFVRRLPNGQGYQVILQPALENFPTGDNVADAETVNNLIEQQTRQAPEQYLWAHRRFKDRPDGEQRFY